MIMNSKMIPVGILTNFLIVILSSVILFIFNVSFVEGFNNIILYEIREIDVVNIIGMIMFGSLICLNFSFEAILVM